MAKTKSFQWWESLVELDRIQEDGLNKKVKEVYLIDASSFTDAEAKTMEVVKEYVTGDFKICDIKGRKYVDVFDSDNATDDIWYQIKVAFIILDEKSGKEKQSSCLYLQQSNSVEDAIKLFRKNFGKEVVTDYTITEVKSTKILDVYPDSYFRK